MTSEVALRFDHVAKSYEVFDSPIRRLRTALSPLGGPGGTTVEVLHDADFSVCRGECLAIIGPNGAGKSTILELAAGVIEPTSGTVSARGTVASLLELGGSFVPELTGRENARFLSEVVAGENGLPPAREREIEEFADIGEFFDRPVRTYSDGMFLRLAFACTSAEEPDILLLDEALGVGDARFQKKCFRRLRELRDRGTTVLLVTHLVHMLPAISDRVLVIDGGELIYDGPPRGGVERYYERLFTGRGATASDRSGGEYRYGDGGARIEHPVASHASEDRSGAFRPGDAVTVSFEVEFARAVEEPQIGFGCSTPEGLSVYATSSALLGGALPTVHAGERRRIEIAFELPVAVADLFVDLTVFESLPGEIAILDARLGVLHLSVARPIDYTGIADLSASIRSSSRVTVSEPR